jgi:hypothetical protein
LIAWLFVRKADYLEVLKKPHEHMHERNKNQKGSTRANLLGDNMPLTLQFGVCE